MPYDQLELPISGLSIGPPSTRIPHSRRLFVNRNLKMASVDWVGFDMDYTLAIYNQAEMDHLSIRTTLAKLCARGYPDVLSELNYRIDFPIRGLLIDKRTGHILKMDKFKVVQKGYHGLSELSDEELRSLYHAKKIRPTTSRYHWIDTLYALSEASLYAGIVAALEERTIPVDYGQLFTDIRECIDEAHRDGTIVERVVADLPRYVDRDPLLAQTLHKFRSAGKKLFLLTNSQWDFTEKLMTYLLDGAMPEYPSYKHYFDVLVVASQKPRFFQERRPLMRRDGDELKPAVAPLERGVIYQGGNLVDFERALGVAGDRILYVGDHIYGDILRSKKESAWRTAMIIQEMEAEVEAHESCIEQHDKSDELRGRRDELEEQLRHYQSRFKEANRKLEEAESGADEGSLRQLEAERLRAKKAVERIRVELRNVNAESRTIARDIDGRFHPYWGSLLKEANEKSSFGDQVEEYACVYTSRVSNFLGYSPLQYFRSSRDLMPHEL